MDEYWDDYGEFNEEIESLRESLKTAVKSEVRKELESLRTENKTLKEKVSNLDTLEREARDIKRKADNEYETAVRRANHAKADEIFKYLEDTKYGVTRNSYQLPKCDKCDKDRLMTFTYPSGKVGTERCVDCGVMQYAWETTTLVGTEVDIRRGELMVWYKPYSTREDDYHSMSGSVRKLYNGEDFEDITRDYMFNDEAKAKEYAEYLNSIVNE